MRAWVGITIAGTALCFQTMVLYPWHLELRDQIRGLKAHLQKLDEEKKNSSS